MSKEIEFIEQLLEVGNLTDVDVLCRERLAELRTVEKAKQISRVSRGKRVMVKIALADGSSKEWPKEVEGIPVGDYFAVFKQPLGSGWQVCHVPSGMKACNARVKRDALVYGAQMSSVDGVDWSQDEPLSGLDKGKFALLRSISRRANSHVAPLNSLVEYL